MRPGERDADNGDGEQHGRDEMTKREPPAGQHQPDDIAEEPERTGADDQRPEYSARDTAFRPNGNSV